MAKRIVVLKYAARATKEDIRTLIDVAYKAGQQYNCLVEAHNNEREKIITACPGGRRGIALRARLRKVADLKQKEQAALNGLNGKKTKLPKERVARYKFVCDRIKEAAKRLPPDENLQSELKKRKDCVNAAVRATNAGPHHTHFSTFELTKAAFANAASKHGWHKKLHFRRFAKTRSHRIGTGVFPNCGTSPKTWSAVKPTPIPKGTWGTHWITVYPHGPKSAAMQVAVKLHRPIGDEEVVKIGYMQIVRRKGFSWDLELCLTVERDAEEFRSVGSVVGVDAGWRAVEGGALRVASTSDGRHIDMPGDVVAMVNKAESIKSIVDRMSSEYWAAHFGALPKVAGRELTGPSLHARIVKSLRDESGKTQFRRVSSLEAGKRWKAGSRTAEDYMAQRKHLSIMQAAIYEKALRKRNEAYRQAAAQIITGDVKAVAVESLRLDNMARGKVAGGQRFAAAPSELLAALRLVAANRGVLVVQIPAANTSQTCSTCGSVHAAGVARDGERFHCPDCGLEAHADTNAAINIAAAGTLAIPSAIEALEQKAVKAAEVREKKRAASAATAASRKRGAVTSK